MASSGAPDWDVVDITGAFLEVVAKEGLLEKKIEATRSEDTKKEFRRLQRQHKADLERLELEAGTDNPSLRTTCCDKSNKRIEESMADAVFLRNAASPISTLWMSSRSCQAARNAISGPIPAGSPQVMAMVGR